MHNRKKTVIMIITSDMTIMERWEEEEDRIRKSLNESEINLKILSFNLKTKNRMITSKFIISYLIISF